MVSKNLFRWGGRSAILGGVFRIINSFLPIETSTLFLEFMYFVTDIFILFGLMFPRWIPMFWVSSTLIGIIGYFIPGLSLLFVLSGVFFGVAFVGAGKQIMVSILNH